MALDESNDQDMTEELNGITFCVAKTLFEKVGNISIDLGYMGFHIQTEFPYADSKAHSSCSSCGGGSCSI